MPVLIGYLVSVLVIAEAMFGLFQISELGFLAGALEQASYFAARSEFVGMRGERGARFLTELARNPFRPGLRYFAAPDGPVAVTIQSGPDGKWARVSLSDPAPSPFRMGEVIPGLNRSGSRCLDPNRPKVAPEVCGLTAIPSRIEP